MLLNLGLQMAEVSADLQDCHAMGAAAKTALAIAVIPYGVESKTEADLHQMMAGGVHALSEAGCSLVGGHTCEGAEMSLGSHICPVSLLHHAADELLEDRTECCIPEVLRVHAALVALWEHGPDEHILCTCP